MRPKSYNILSYAIEVGLDCGWSMAHKQADNPGEDLIKDCIHDAIMSEISEWFDFDEAEVARTDREFVEEEETEVEDEDA